MGFGDTAKKLQKVADMAEDVYRKLNELREQVIETKETVEDTRQRVDSLEADTAEQRAILEALAEQQGVDIENAIAEAHISEAETGEESGDAGGTGDATDGADTDAGQQASADPSS
jgi:GAF domain-containing protein